MMNKVELINNLLFDYSKFKEEEIFEMIVGVEPKLLRWLGANHPDNKTRKLFFKKTNISIGTDTVINQNFIVSDDYKPLLSIGRRVAISPNVTIVCASGPNNSTLSINNYVSKSLIVSKPVEISDDVWIGANAVIMPGVVIGKGSIIGAGSVVTKSIPDHTIYAGVPAKFIRKLI